MGLQQQLQQQLQPMRLLLLLLLPLLLLHQIAAAAPQHDDANDWLLQTAGPVQQLLLGPPPAAAAPETAAAAAAAADWTAVAVAASGTVSGLQAATGELCWRLLLGGNSWHLLQQQQLGPLLLLLADVSHPLQRAAAGTAAAAAADAATAATASKRGTLHVIDLREGVLLWKARSDVSSFAAATSGPTAAAAAAAAGTAAAELESAFVAVHTPHEIETRDLFSGRVLWTKPLSSRSSSSSNSNSSGKYLGLVPLQLEQHKGGMQQAAFCLLQQQHSNGALSTVCFHAWDGQQQKQQHQQQKQQHQQLESLSGLQDPSIVSLGDNCFALESRSVERAATAALPVSSGLFAAAAVSARSLKSGLTEDGWVFGPVQNATGAKEQQQVVAVRSFDDFAEAKVVDLQSLKQTPLLREALPAAAAAATRSSVKLPSPAPAALAAVAVIPSEQPQQQQLLLLLSDLSLVMLQQGQGAAWVREEGLSLVTDVVLGVLPEAAAGGEEPDAAVASSTGIVQAAAAAAAAAAAEAAATAAAIAVAVGGAAADAGAVLLEKGLALVAAAVGKEGVFHESPGEGAISPLFDFKLPPALKLRALGLQQQQQQQPLLQKEQQLLLQQLTARMQRKRSAELVGWRGIFVAANCNSKIYGLHAATGLLVWQLQLPSSSSGGCCCCSMMRSSNSHLAARAAANGKASWDSPADECPRQQQQQQEEQQQHELCEWRLKSLELVGLHKGTVFVALVNRKAQETRLLWVDLGTGALLQQQQANFAALSVLPLQHLELQDAAAAAAASAVPAAADADAVLRRLQHSSSAVLLLYKQQQQQQQQQQMLLALADPLQQLTKAASVTNKIPLPLAYLLSHRLSFYFPLACEHRLEGSVLLPVPSAELKDENAVVMKAQISWAVDFSAQKQILLAIASSMHRFSRQVPVFVHADVSVGYKLIDPNLLAVVTAEEEVGGALVLYLLSSVSGGIEHQQVLPAGASQPLLLAVCEDSVYVHFWNMFAARFELLVVSLTEDRPDPGPLGLIFASGRRSPHKSGFSVARPLAASRSYAIPSSATALGLTTTAQGVAPRSLILASGSTQQIHLLSTRLASAKRPLPSSVADAATAAAAAAKTPDGLSVYKPVLSLLPVETLSMNRKVPLVRGIFSHPSERESTSFVLAFGHDLFFAPAQPASSFDVLPPSFPYPSLLLAFAALIAAAAAADYTKRKNALSAKWATMVPQGRQQQVTLQGGPAANTQQQQQQQQQADSCKQQGEQQQQRQHRQLQQEDPRQQHDHTEQGQQLKQQQQGQHQQQQQQQKGALSVSAAAPPSAARRPYQVAASPAAPTAAAPTAAAAEAAEAAASEAAAAEDAAASPQNIAARTVGLIAAAATKGSPQEAATAEDILAEAVEEDPEAEAASASAAAAAADAAAATGRLDLFSATRLTIRAAPELLLNGVAAPKGWRRLVGFCLQQDLLLQQLSVQQTLLLEAKLRLGRVCSKQQRRQRVDKVIQMMNLEKCRNTLVGSPFSRGLSGGERRRLSVACELLLPKPLLLLDEPTRHACMHAWHLSAASHLLRLLQQVARENGTAVVCSIHQPSSQLFLSFDRVVFLSEGYLVFCGQPQQLRSYEALLLQPPAVAVGAAPAAAADAPSKAAAASSHADPTGAVAAAAGAMFDSEEGPSAVAARTAPGATAAAAEAAEAATATRPDCCRGLMAEIEKVLQQQQQQKPQQQLLLLQETEQRHQEAQGVAQILDLIFRVYRDHKTLVLRDDFQAIAAAAIAAEAAAVAAAEARASARQGDSDMQAERQQETRIAKTVHQLSPPPAQRGRSASSAAETQRAAAAAGAAAADAAAAEAGAASLQQVSIHRSSSGVAAAAAAAAVAKRRELLAAAAAIKAASSPLLQFEVLLQRQLIAEARGKAAAADLIQALVLGVIVGSMYFQQMKHYTTDTLHERLALLYFLCNYHIFSPAFTSLNAFPAIRAVAAAGSSSKLFAATTFLAASSCAELLLQLLAPLAMLLLLHIMVAWPSNVGVFLAVWLSLMLLTIISSSLGQLIAALAGSDHRLGALLLSVSLISLTLVGGFYISLNLLPPWVGWLVYLSPVSYAVPNLLHATLGSRLIACSSDTSSTESNGSSIGGDLGCSGEGLTAQQVAEGTSLGLPVAANVAVLLGFLFLIKAATLVLLKRRLQIQN
ncbi:hypothetical protein Esti_002851 [Eimeria stiedai]